MFFERATASSIFVFSRRLRAGVAAPDAVGAHGEHRLDATARIGAHRRAAERIGQSRVASRDTREIEHLAGRPSRIGRVAEVVVLQELPVGRERADHTLAVAALVSVERRAERSARRGPRPARAPAPHEEVRVARAHREGAAAASTATAAARAHGAAVLRARAPRVVRAGLRARSASTVGARRGARLGCPGRADDRHPTHADRACVVDAAAPRRPCAVAGVGARHRSPVPTRVRAGARHVGGADRDRVSTHAGRSGVLETPRPRVVHAGLRPRGVATIGTRNLTRLGCPCRADDRRARRHALARLVAVAVRPTHLLSAEVRGAHGARVIRDRAPHAHRPAHRALNAATRCPLLGHARLMGGEAHRAHRAAGVAAGRPVCADAARRRLPVTGREAPAGAVSVPVGETLRPRNESRLAPVGARGGSLESTGDAARTRLACTAVGFGTPAAGTAVGHGSGTAVAAPRDDEGAVTAPTENEGRENREANEHQGISELHFRLSCTLPPWKGFC